MVGRHQREKLLECRDQCLREKAFCLMTALDVKLCLDGLALLAQEAKELNAFSSSASEFMISVASA